ncbi:MAG: hypothetical protein OMM_11820, partial [Candidatus Magnetoglobus multicellularis str. Araruama]
KSRNALNRYNTLTDSVEKRSVDLHELRKKSSNEVITLVENYVNILANSPKEFDKSFSEYKAEFKVFNDLLYELRIEAAKSDIQTGSAAGSGIATGIGVAAFGPTAAMAVATTFGTASTGTAIATLSGAAATNAALAWLGGGALVAGGGGIAAGEALLALAGPIGWTIGGIGLLGGGLLARRKNKKIAVQAVKERKKIEVGIATLKAAEREIASLINQTNLHINGINKLLLSLKEQAPIDYKMFTVVHKEKLASLINHIQSLSKLLNKKVQ